MSVWLLIVKTHIWTLDFQSFHVPLEGNGLAFFSPLTRATEYETCSICTTMRRCFKMQQEDERGGLTPKNLPSLTPLPFASPPLPQRHVHTLSRQSWCTGSCSVPLTFLLSFLLSFCSRNSLFSFFCTFSVSSFYSVLLLYTFLQADMKPGPAGRRELV